MNAKKLRAKVLVVGWDGVRDDVLRELRPSAIGSIADNGHWWSTIQPDVDVAHRLGGRLVHDALAIRCRFFVQLRIAVLLVNLELCRSLR